LPADKISYQIFGAEHSETLVMVHGLGSALDTFKNVVPELSTKYRVLIYDQRGHGKTPAVGDNYSTTAMAHDLKALVDHLGIKKFHLLGHSIGVRPALRFAVVYPEMVRSLIIEDFDVTQKRAPDNYEYADDLALMMRRELPDKYASKSDMRKALRPYWDTAGVNYQVDEKSKKNPDGTWSFLTRPDVIMLYDAQSGRESLTALLDKLQIPVLVMHGNPAKGSAMTRPGLRSIRAHVKDLKIVELERAGHVLHREAKEKFLETLTKFMDDVPHE
jgi:2-succinyl-6-hydroxy-2,4-cyclohexadiene-1-carboxylate synthase